MIVHELIGGIFVNYCVVLLPSEEVQHFSNSHRKLYDKEYSFPSYITLKHPFRLDAHIVTEQLQKIATNTNPLNITMKKIGSFAPANNMIFLKVERTKELTSLVELLHNDVFADKPQLVPHISLGKQESAEEHFDVYGRLSMQHIYFNETIIHLHLLYQLENGAWNICETFSFRKDAVK